MKRRVKQAGKQSWYTHLQWLQPGLGVKRWLLLLAFGVGLLSLGGASAFRALYPLPVYFHYFTLQFLPRYVRAALFLIAGFGSIGVALWALNRTLLGPFVEGTFSSVPGLLYNYRRRGRGAKIVVIGGGHGQSTVLRGLKQYTSNLTAIVTVADDGGSSGRLRRDLGILPPGDFRNCIAALADDEALITRLYQYRFAGGDDLRGHSFGNLFISAMAGITGSFESALKESSRVLAVQGQVLPSTLEAVTLCADVQQNDGTLIRVRGESGIPEAHGQILRVMLEPATPRAYPEAVRAILEADLVVIGPGSLYTSILPNLLVPEIAQALEATRAPKVYVCNVATQSGETDGYTAQEHIQALEKHLGTNIISTAVINTHIPESETAKAIEWVQPNVETHKGFQVITKDLVDETLIGHHESGKIARTLMDILVK
ncbi:MAG TPA: YvcK family protein [Anaerolineae bacterium]|nr:YvcK family protein [Anaerolineae bacterium]HQI85421.1 YvcK family protein [Anaerolineae bacterium]